MRKGKIAIENISGGMVTSSPLLSTPSRYSRLLQNYYINAAGHVKKIPGYSAISNQVSNVRITTGVDFNKTDGTSIKIVGGRNGASGALYRLNSGVLTGIKTNFASLNPLYLSQIGDLIVASNGSDLPISYDGTTIGNISMPFDVGAVAFVGTGLNDMSTNVTSSTGTTYQVQIDGVAIPNPTVTHAGTGGQNDMTAPNANYSGAAATANFDVEIDSTGSGDTVKYNVNGGAFVTGQALVTALAGLDFGVVRLKASSTIGHNSDDTYEFQVSTAGTPDKFKWRKNGGAWSAEINCTAYPTYTALDADYSIAFEVSTGNVVGDIYLFQVDGATTPDKFRWRKDVEAWTSLVPIAAGNMLLKEGVYVKFKYFTGHTSGGSGNTWTFNVARDTVKYRDILGAWTTGVVITGAFQNIVAGVQFKFSSINGHTLNDIWSIPVDQSVRFGRSYVYKNRLWCIGQDAMTVYHSALLLPTDFTGDGSGYIDFRYVLPEADTLVDICSLMNFLVFFFKNHIVIYSGTDPTATGDFVIYQNIPDMGIIAPGNIVSVGSDIFFLTNRGIKSLNQTITAGALNVGNVSEAIDIDVIAAIDANTSGVYASAHYATLGLIMFAVGNTIFVYSYRQKAWSEIVVPSSDNVSKILSMFQTADGYVYMGGYNYLFEFDPTPDTNNFAGVAPAYRWTSGMFQATSAESMYFTDMVLRLASTAAATMTMKVRAIGFDTGVEDQSAFNQQTVTVPAITVNDAVFNFVHAPLFGAGKFIQFDFTESPTYDANGDVEISAIEVSGELGIV